MERLFRKTLVKSNSTRSAEHNKAAGFDTLRFIQRILSITMAVCTAIFIAVQTAFSAAEYDAEIAVCFDYFTQSRSAEDFWDGLEYGTQDWAAFCRLRLYGNDGSQHFADSAVKHVEELSSGGFVRPTEYQRAAICIAAAGGDAQNAAEAAAFCNDRLDRQGLNAYIWGLIAVNVTAAQPPENAVNTAESLTEYLLSKQLDDGSFTLMGTSGDVDITSAAVYALMGQQGESGRQAAQRAADWLCGLEEYTSMGAENCESTAQAVIALCAAGRAESARQAVQRLESFRTDGGYSHLKGENVNAMATSQALQAFTALELMERGETLFSPSRTLPEQTSEVGGEPEPFTAEVETAKPPLVTGMLITAAISAASAVGAAVFVIIAAVRKRKSLLVCGILLAALSGGVWLLDIRTPEEYYSQQQPGGMTVTVSADCTAALRHMGDIDPEINPPEVVPQDGRILEEYTVDIPEGSSAFDALIAAARENQVRVDYTGSTYGVYVRGIGHIYEFGFGQLSGWLYCVNGEYPEVSASELILSEGDRVEFVYTCDLGMEQGVSAP